MEGRTVTIDTERYEELINTETRVFIAKDMILRDGWMKLTDLLSVLGFVELAKQLDERQKETAKKILEDVEDDDE